MSTKSRKQDHLDICAEEGIEHSRRGGFECMDFLHNALPELDFNDIKLESEFFGKKIFPIMITAMTGGGNGAGRINTALAEAAEKHGFALGLGSQRPMLEGGGAQSYMLRKAAPSIPVLGNIGAAQLGQYPMEKIEGLVSKVEADGLAIHLNVLQEMVQPEGDRNFKGVLKSIGKVCERLDVPVMVKETGAGIGRDAALKLREVGVKWLDVSGSGGTSWSKVEYERGGTPPGFGEWGLPTAVTILMCKDVLPVVGSGGVRSGVDAAKAVTLGASAAGASRPFLLAYNDKRLDAMCAEWKQQMRICAMLTGCRDVDALKKAPFAVTGWLKDWLE
ncbi:MAG: type 2 isopentenyl-diphosphate Delta-isomerase [Candidatus ainarchaeum sp.]|nr:type 2 isopentenyl-diphosphate Delta-isomerase [Candidatus ainarchaeum sp.]MDD5096169.1 type 2 isopentenyl-diphosphate Delta-isomerase [Candidatus ainarchaeum sp.]